MGVQYENGTDVEPAGDSVEQKSQVIREDALPSSRDDEAADSVEYVVESESDDTTTEAPTASQPAQEASEQATAKDLPLDVRQALERAEAAERRANEVMGQLQPFLQRMAAPAQTQVNPSTLLEKLKSGEGTPEDLVQYLQVSNQELIAQIAQASEQRASAAASEQQARGRFNQNAMGDGRDFDSMRARYLSETYRQNPHLRELIRQTVPTDPAFGEYVFTVVSRVIEKVGGDPIKGLRAVLDAIESPAESRAAAEVVENITKATASGAKKVLGGGKPSGTRQVRKINPEDIWKMSDEEFDAFNRQHGAGI